MTDEQQKLLVEAIKNMKWEWSSLCTIQPIPENLMNNPNTERLRETYLTSLATAKTALNAAIQSAKNLRSLEEDQSHEKRVTNLIEALQILMLEDLKL